MTNPKSESEKQVVWTLNDESFKRYLFQRYVSNSYDVKWSALQNLSTDQIPAKIWTQLYNMANAEIKSSGGYLTGYEIINGIFVSHECKRRNNWPSEWMWVLCSKAS